MLPGLINPNRNQAPPPMPEATNLITRVSPEELARPAGFWTSIVLDSLTALSATATGLAYRTFLDGNLSIWLVLVPAGLFGIASVFQMFLSRAVGRRLGVVAVSALGIVIFFYDQPLSFLVSIWATTFLFLAWGDLGGKYELRNALDLKFMRLSKPVLNRVLTALALAAVLLYIPRWNAEESFLTKDQFGSVFGSGTRVVNQFYAELNFNSSFDEFAESVVRLQFTGNPVFMQLLPAARQKAVEEAKGQVLAGFEEEWGVDIEPERKTSEVFYDYFIAKLNQWRDSFGDRFLFAWAVAAFFLVRGFGFFFYLILAGISYFLYQLLMAFGILRLAGESRTKEVLEYLK